MHATGMIRNFSHDMSFGARPNPQGVAFRIWAPAQERLALLLSPGARERRIAMARDGEGWFACTLHDAGPGDRYLYELADGTRVPDPASRFQPLDVEGPSEVIDPLAYTWRHPQWQGRPWHEAVVYEAHVGAFSAPGDYDGVRAKLAHLAALGVTALELMPLADFPGRRNWGYDGVLPFAPDSSYGRPEALKSLIDAAHGHGLMVLLDVVYNHFGPSGNWLGAYAPQFFTDRHHTPWGRAIDFRRAEVRRFFIDNALYWLDEYRFDGLRLDAVDQIRDDSPTHVLTELAASVRQRIRGRHVHLVLENDANAAHLLAREGVAGYDAQWNDDFHHAAHVLATAEHEGYYADYAEAPVAHFARALAEGFVQQGCHSAYRGRARGEPSAALPPFAFVDFLQNHDQVGNRAMGDRLSTLVGPAPMQALMAILLLAPAVPMLFMGQEWDCRQPFLFFCDFHADLANAVREGRRAEFDKFAAFAEPGARATIPDPNARQTFLASVLDWRAAALPAASAWLDYCSELLAIRRREVVPWLGGAVRGGTFQVAGRVLQVEWCLGGGKQLRLTANLSAAPAPANGCPPGGRRLHAVPAQSPPEACGTLPPWSVYWSIA